MPKRRLSFEQAEARGSNQINAGRFKDRQDMPETTGALGDPPKHLPGPVKKVWKELAQVIPAGVAGETERQKLELAAQLLSQFRTNPTNMPTSRIALLEGMLGRLGLDPQARTKMHVSPPKETKPTDPYGKYMDALTHDNTESIQ